MMVEDKSDEERMIQRKIQVLSSWSSLLGVIFRLILILGLLLLIFFMAIFLFTSLVPVWFIVFPFIVILLGIFIARIEYYLHKRLTMLQPHSEKHEDPKDNQNDSVS